MKLYGLTGGIGMGKSTAAELLRARGVAVVDTDVLARQVVEPGQPALAEVRERFGAEVIAADGTLRREDLAKCVFADATARRDLENILHPRIRALWQGQVEAWRSEGRAVGVVVIPLLFETHAEAHFDAVICAACSAATQQARLASRGWPVTQIQQRIAAQWPIEKKMAAAHFIVWTEAGLDVHAAQLDRIFSAR